MQETDVLIVGAGPSGLSFARSLKNTGLDVCLVEKSDRDSLADPAEDGREIALTHASHEIMNKLGIWQRLEDDAVAPINHARVLSGDSPYSLDFNNRKDSKEPLGFLVPNHLIRKACFEEVEAQSNVTLISSTTVEDVKCNEQGCEAVLSNGDKVKAALVVAADSRFSSVRKNMGVAADMRDFSRVAIVCRMKHEKSHQQTATEYFQYGQTMAALPMNGNMSSIVVTLSTDKSGAILDMDEQQFNQYVGAYFSHILGEIALVGKRHHYPLVGVHAKKFIAERFALIGDAAVGMHPVTAHGFNLGLRGQETLCNEIKKAQSAGNDFFSRQVLEKYQRKHMIATRPMYHGTNAVVGLFTNDQEPAKFIRNLTLRVANNLPPLKALITHKLTEKKIALPFLS